MSSESSGEEYESVNEKILQHREIPIRDYDDFFKKAYVYHTSRGITCLILQSIKKIIMYSIIGFVTLFVINFIDYDKWFSAMNINSVLYITDYISFGNIGVFSWIILPIYLMSLTAYVSYHTYTIKKFWFVREFYGTALGLGDDQLENYEWEVIAEKIGKLFYGKHDALSIAQRIMRKDNYMIGLVTHNIIQPVLFTQIVEWVITYTLKRTLFYKSWGKTQELSLIYRDTPQFSDNVKRLNGYMFIYGIVSIFLLPFIGIGMFVYYVYRYTLQSQSSSRPSLNLFSKEWNWKSKWYFREINELDHLFHTRLSKSYKYADKYSSQFPNNEISIIAQLFIFICGVLLSVLILYGVLLSDELLWNTLFLNHSLMLYASILTVLIGFAYKVIPDKYYVFDQQKYMNGIIENIKYVPDDWKHNATRRSVYKQFSEFYEYKWYIAIKEFASIFTIPYILMFYLPRNMNQILDFYVQNSVQCEKSGYVYKESKWNSILNESGKLAQSQKHFMDVNKNYELKEEV